MARQLPPELIDIIIDCFCAAEEGNDLVQGLKACVSAHSSFHHRCQSTLFRDITIRRHQDVHNLLGVSPRIFAYVHVLLVAHSFTFDKRLSEVRLHIVSPDMAAFNRVVRLLTNVHDLRVDSSSNGVKYTTLPTDTYLALLEGPAAESTDTQGLDFTAGLPQPPEREIELELDIRQVHPRSPISALDVRCDNCRGASPLHRSVIAGADVADSNARILRCDPADFSTYSYTTV